MAIKRHHLIFTLKSLGVDFGELLGWKDCTPAQGDELIGYKVVSDIRNASDL